MKPVFFYILIPSAIVIFFTGCPMRIGECTYGKIPDQRGTLVIKSIEKVKIENNVKYKVSVDGFFNREFLFSEEEYHRKISSKGDKKGSELEGVIYSGGPCPPIYYILD